MKHNKKFDCVKMKWDIQAKIAKEFEGMPDATTSLAYARASVAEEQAHRIQDERVARNPILGPFLRKTTFYDPDHSVNERRFITVGLSNRARLLVVSHTNRDHTIRIINTRKATRAEREYYEEQT